MTQIDTCACGELRQNSILSINCEIASYLLPVRLVPTTDRRTEQGYVAYQLFAVQLCVCEHCSVFFTWKKNSIWLVDNGHNSHNGFVCLRSQIKMGWIVCGRWPNVQFIFQWECDKIGSEWLHFIYSPVRCLAFRREMFCVSHMLRMRHLKALGCQYSCEFVCRPYRQNEQRHHHNRSNSTKWVIDSEFIDEKMQFVNQSQSKNSYHIFSGKWYLGKWNTMATGKRWRKTDS